MKDRKDYFYICVGEYDYSYVYLFYDEEPEFGITDNGSKYWRVRTRITEKYPYTEFLGTRIPMWIMNEVFKKYDIPLASSISRKFEKYKFDGHPNKMFNRIGVSYNDITKKLEIG